MAYTDMHEYMVKNMRRIFPTSRFYSEQKNGATKNISTFSGGERQ